jgi:transitional endoplasmic reticulum ATPase
VAATNRPDMIDDAILRPGRLDTPIYVPPPDAAARADILRIAVRKTPLAADVNLDELARRTDGYSSADCTALITKAAMQAMREEDHSGSSATVPVTQTHIEEALAQVRPSINSKQLRDLEAFASRFT